MNRSRTLAGLLSAALLFSSPALFADDPAPKPSRDTLEAIFARTMSGAKLVGFFTEDGKEDEAPRPETYTLGKVEKVEGDSWRFEALVEYGGKSFPFAMRLDVLWAGDTPVITLTDRKIPLLGTFTARVMIHGERYAGIWSGAGHSGQMTGRVVRAALETPADEGEKGAGVHWPTFRGPGARGIAEGFETATTWNVETGENVKWTAEVPGLAHSSPVIFGDRIFLTTAVRQDGPAELKVGLYGDPMSLEDESVHAFDVLCFDKETGEMLWSRTAHTGVPKVKRHLKGSHAASTPATDGERVVAFFGSEGLYCYDMDGELLWRKDLGVLDSGYYIFKGMQWGFASSPILHEGKVIVQCDVQKDSFLALFDAATGEEVWRTPRTEVPTWGSPTVDVREGRSQVVVNGWKHIGGYDLATGAELWKLVGGGDVPVPTPVVAHDLIFITNAHGRMAPIYAIHANASGVIDMEHEHMAWSTRKHGNYMQTPLVHGDYLYCCSDFGVLACYDARTGEEHYRRRISSGKGGFTASMVVAGGKLYATNEDGEIHVFRIGPEYERLAINDMGEECMATPAASEGVLFWRSRGHLIAIEEE